ncbi:uncharacterized protein J3R85_021182 [Psidium guajava]|nr:uncharacterized protein J3R85_021182 [Psidium guajava]
MGENGGAVPIKLKLKLKLESSPPPLPTSFRRRNSIATSVVLDPAKLSLPTATKAPAHALSFPNGAVAPAPRLDLSGDAFASYTSLKDILPAVSPTAAASSPTAAASSSYEISIRNRLVNRAAWAYLRPTSASPGSHGPDLVRRLWDRLSACLGFVRRAFDRIVRFFSPVRAGR